VAGEDLALRIEGVHAYYGPSYVLQGVTLDVPAQRVTAIVGRNGVGKTTLINTIMGLVPVTRGRILVGSIDVVGLEAYHRRQLGLALVPQGRRVFGSLTVEEHFHLTKSAPGGLFTRERVLDLFPPLRERLSSLARQLSGGEQMMLSIARALIANPHIMLMDEPTEGLAPLIVGVVHDTVVAMRDAGITVLLVEQNLEFALSLADWIAVMERGAITHVFKREEIGDVEALSDLIIQGGGRPFWEGNDNLSH